MNSGYTKAWRKELESDIWLMPPLYLKIWYYLRHKVEWEPYLFPTRSKFGIWVLPGQRLTSVRQIAEGVKWTEWGKEIIPNTKTITEALKWLESREMIRLESNDKGTLITILNWDTYNYVDIEKVTVRGHSLDSGLDTGKEFIRIHKNKSLNPSSSGDDLFHEFWKMYPRKVGKGAAEKAWKKIKEPRATLELISIALKWQRISENWTKNNGEFIPHPSTYLNQRRWEDEHKEKQGLVDRIIDMSREESEQLQRVRAAYECN